MAFCCFTMEGIIGACGHLINFILHYLNLDTICDIKTRFVSRENGVC